MVDYLRSNCDPSSAPPMTNPMELVKALKFFGRHGTESNDQAAMRRNNERRDAADLIEAQAAQLAEREVAVMEQRVRAIEAEALLQQAREGMQMAAERLSVEAQSAGFNLETQMLRRKMGDLATDTLTVLTAIQPGDSHE